MPLRYILNPADVKGLDYLSETFRVFKNREIHKYGDTVPAVSSWMHETVWVLSEETACPYTQRRFL